MCMKLKLIKIKPVVVKFDNIKTQQGNQCEGIIGWWMVTTQAYLMYLFNLSPLLKAFLMD